MKKKIVAVLAAIAAVFGFGFASNAAMAEDYGSINANGTTVSVTFKGFQPGEAVTVTADKGSEVVKPAAAKELKTTADKNGEVVATVKDVPCATTVTVTATGEKTGAKTQSVKTAECAASTNTEKTNPNTGASVAPFAVAVALLAAAGVAVAAVRKTNAR